MARRAYEVDPRLELAQPITTLPELELWGFDRLQRALHLPRHRHIGMLTVTYVESGMVQWLVGEREYMVHGGQIVVAQPGTLLAGADEILAPCTLHWLLLRLPRRLQRGYLGLPGEDARRMQHALCELPERPFAASHQLHEQFVALAAALRVPSAMKSIAVRVNLLHLLVEMCVAADAVEPDAAMSHPVMTVIRLIDAQVGEPLAVPELAKRVGLSTSHLQRLFRAETGLAVGDYFLRRRLAAARHLLSRTNMKLVEIALHCGFGSSQYFATSFRRQYGETPSEFRRRTQAGEPD